MMRTYNVVYLLLAEQTNRSLLLDVGDVNRDFLDLLGEALQAVGVNFKVGDTVVARGRECFLADQRMTIEYSLTELTRNPSLRMRLGGNLAYQLPLEKLVGLFKCTELFKTAWRAALEKYKEQPDYVDSSHIVTSSIRASISNGTICDDVVDHPVDSECYDRQPRLSEGSISSDESFFLWYSSSDSNSSCMSNKENNPNASNV
jgi:hypothetical protein